VSVLNLFLQNPEGKGYPFPYVLARIRGRRSRRKERPTMPEAATVAETAETRLEQGDAPLAAARAERNWLWSQLEPDMRNAFAPLVFYHELKPLALAIRRREVRQWDQVAAIMEGSLLVTPLLLLVADDRIGTKEALERIGRFMQRILPGFGHLEDVYLTGGIGAVEGRILNVTLGLIAAHSLQPGLQTFFIRLIDMLNLLTLFRHQRWRSETVPSFVPGGRISTKRLNSWQGGRGAAERDACVAALTGSGALPESPSELEEEFMRGMTRFCRRLSRDPDGIGLLVEYLWSLYLEARYWRLSVKQGGVVRTIPGEELMA